MDVVEGEDVQEMVRRSVFPGLGKGGGLCGEGGGGEDDAFLASR